MAILPALFELEEQGTLSVFCLTLTYEILVDFFFFDAAYGDTERERLLLENIIRNMISDFSRKSDSFRKYLQEADISLDIQLSSTFSGGNIMCGKQRFFICKHCGNTVGLIQDKGIPLVCCGEAMTELIPNTVEASVEKHLPVVTLAENGITVQIGSTIHPMEDAHHIMVVYVETTHGGGRKCLRAGDAPQVTFSFTADDIPIAVYAYCNIHGLWKTPLQ